MPESGPAPFEWVTAPLFDSSTAQSSDTLVRMKLTRVALGLARATAFLLMLAAVAAFAQGRFREGSLGARYAPALMPDASFVVCRIAYRSVRVEPMGIGWQTDYPFAEINL